jgi:acetyl-CoA carboxylase carboxyl transferase subunit alpha
MASLEFERPLLELERRITELKSVIAAAGPARPGLQAEVARLEDKARRLQGELFSGLSTWQKVQLSRHPDRPYTLDYAARLFDDFVELHGDRAFADDRSIVGGLARFRGRPVVVIGHQKGRGVKDAMARNFGMPHPEGYRKAMRLMDLADRFNRPHPHLHRHARRVPRPRRRGARGRPRPSGSASCGSRGCASPWWPR